MIRFITVIFVILINAVSCKIQLILRTSIAHNETIWSKAYSALPWSLDDIQALPRPVIPLDLVFGSFNPCVASSFTVETMKPIVELHQPANATGGWVALVRYHTLEQTCKGIIPLHWNYMAYAAASAQSCGAAALLVYQEPVMYANIKFGNVPPQVDVQARTVFGTDVHIPALLLADTSIGSGLNSITALVPSLVSHVERISLQTIALTPDTNPFAETIFAVRGPYRICWLLLAAILVFLLVPLTLSTMLGAFRQQVSMSSSARSLKILISVSTLGAMVFGLLTALDPLGIFHLFDYFLARFFFQMTSDLSIIGDIGTILYIWDVYKTFQCSRLMQVCPPLLVRYRSAILAIFMVAFLIGALDVVFLFVSILHLVSGNPYLFSSLYQIFLHVSTNLTLFMLITLLKRELRGHVTATEVPLNHARMFGVAATTVHPESNMVTTTLASQAGTVLPPRLKAEDMKLDRLVVTQEASSSTPVSTPARPANMRQPDPHQRVATLVKRFQRIQSFIYISIVARGVFTVALILLGLDMQCQSPAAYAGILLSLGYSFLIFFTVQILVLRVRISILKD